MNYLILSQPFLFDNLDERKQIASIDLGKNDLVGTIPPALSGMVNIGK